MSEGTRGEASGSESRQPFRLRWASPTGWPGICKGVAGMKLVVTISHGSNNDKSSVGWTIANVAKSGGHEVAVFLTSDGVYCAKVGYADAANVRPFKPLEELVRTFLDAKGTVWACSPCVQHRGLKPDDFLPGIVVTGAGALVEWLASGAQSLSF